MTKQEYEAYFEELKARGYKFGGSWYNKPYYRKVIEYREDEDGKRTQCVTIGNINMNYEHWNYTNNIQAYCMFLVERA